MWCPTLQCFGPYTISLVYRSFSSVAVFVVKVGNYQCCTVFQSCISLEMNSDLIIREQFLSAACTACVNKFKIVTKIRAVRPWSVSIKRHNVGNVSIPRQESSSGR